MKENDTVFTDDYSNQHHISDLLGKGGQGAVYRTHDSAIALKFSLNRMEEIETEAEQVERFKQKIQNIRILPIPEKASLAKPVALLKSAAGYVMNQLNQLKPLENIYLPKDFIAYWQKRVEEGTYPQWIPADETGFYFAHYAESGGLWKRLDLLANCADTLALLHSQGLVYGDISMNNIFAAPEPGDSRITLIDCDNLCFENPNSSSGVFTPGYGAPELVNMRAGAGMQTDCWAFAVLAHMLLTLTHPFVGNLVKEAEDDWASDASQDAMQEKAMQGELPWIEDPENLSNHTEDGLPRSLAFTKELRLLFQETFCAGREQPRLRPSIFHWGRTLRQAADRCVICPNCGMSWYVDQDEPLCLYCGGKKVVIFSAEAWPNGGGEKIWEYTDTWFNENEDGSNGGTEPSNIKEGKVISLPSRLFMPYSSTQNDIPYISISFKNRQVFIAKTDECPFGIRYALGKAENFVPISGRIAFSKNDFQKGLYLFCESRSPRIIFCQRKENY